MAKFRDKYRIESARRPGWDYRTPGAYFISICTYQRQHFFGECRNGTMMLSTMGAIVQGFWFEIPKFSHHVQLGAFVVMPDHLHGILILGERESDSDSVSAPVSAPGFYRRIVPKPGSVSTIIGSYKSVCTKHIRRAFPDAGFRWQERFHDHIIRDERAFDNISRYIRNNPKNWKGD